MKDSYVLIFCMVVGMVLIILAVFFLLTWDPTWMNFGGGGYIPAGMLIVGFPLIIVSPIKFFLKRKRRKRNYNNNIIQ
ncbi:MAG: hypothetical protein ACFFA4_16560 [Promethearchaeota archaeon]